MVVLDDERVGVIGEHRTQRFGAIGGHRRTVTAGEIARLRGSEAHELSARNRFQGIVREIKREGLLAQVELEAGPFRVVAVVTREAVEELGLEPGGPATAIVKATSVMLER